MADTNWLEIFRSCTDAEVLAARTRLLTGISPFVSQTVGAKSYQMSPEALASCLSMASRVAGERGLIVVTRPKQSRFYTTDFSGDCAT